MKLSCFSRDIENIDWQRRHIHEFSLLENFWWDFRRIVRKWHIYFVRRQRSRLSCVCCDDSFRQCLINSWGLPSKYFNHVTVSGSSCIIVSGRYLGVSKWWNVVNEHYSQIYDLFLGLSWRNRNFPALITFLSTW